MRETVAKAAREKTNTDREPRENEAAENSKRYKTNTERKQEKNETTADREKPTPKSTAKR